MMRARDNIDARVFRAGVSTARHNHRPLYWHSR